MLVYQTMSGPGEARDLLRPSSHFHGPQFLRAAARGVGTTVGPVGAVEDPFARALKKCCQMGDELEEDKPTGFYVP